MRTRAAIRRKTTRWDRCSIKPLIGIRSVWKDEDKTKLLDGEPADNILYDESGQVCCQCPQTGEQREMAFAGFEKDRKCLMYRCRRRPADCSARGARSARARLFVVRGVVRVKLETDRRIFTPIARSSNAWARSNKRRTAVERFNSRIDGSFGFEKHYIRGK